jgi:hypothetical protein
LAWLIDGIIIQCYQNNQDILITLIKDRNICYRG